MSISIHAPTRGATDSTYKLDGLSYISIHAPTRGATGIPDAIFYKYRFQSTLPREERRCVTCQNKSRFIFQSTLPREERRFWRLGKRLFCKISIHAPTRGATCSYLDRANRESISIHAPTRGATFVFSRTPSFPWNFNPRSHERSDSTCV